jgi:hypothetical protein
MASRIKRDATTTVYTTNPGIDVGQIFETDFGDRVMFVKNTGADTDGVVAKLAFYEAAGARGEICMDDAEVTNGTLGTVTRPAGVFLGAIPFGGFGWIQVSGRCNVYTDDGVADGDYLVADGGATVTGIADTAVAGEEHAVFGCAQAADNDTTHLVVAQVWFQ